MKMQKRAARHADTEPSPPVTGIQILVVEDSPTQAVQLGGLLEAHGCQVAEARNGLEALSLLAESLPDIVLSDVVMPEMDGYELCRRIKADPLLAGVPVLLVTSLSDPADVVRALECGADDFIIKPYAEDNLIARVQLNLANRQLHAADRPEIGVEVFFAGHRHCIGSGRLQILNLLLSTYETAVRRNLDLERAREELEALNESLDEKVRERSAALAASELRYRRLFESAKDGILILDADTGVVVDVNPYLAEMLDFPADRIIGRYLWDLGPLRNILATRAAFTELRGKGYVRHEDLPLETSDGREIPVELVSTSYLVDGRAVIQCNIRDISARKRAEEALRTEQERFRLAAESAIDVIYEWDIGDRVEWFGKVDELMGHLPGEFPRTLEGWANLLHPEDRERVSAAVERQLKGEAAYNIEYRIRKKDGTYGYWSARGTVLRNATGEPYRWIGSVTDITERKRAEEQIQKLNAELEQRVRERTAELQAANKELEAFSYSVSHDLRAPLRAIDGFARIVLEDHAERLDGEGNRQLNVIRANTQKMGRLIDDLLAFSRAGRAELRRTVVDMKALVHSVFQELVPAEEERARIDFSVGDLTNASADPALIHQVWVNLLANAVKFSRPRERAVIRVTGERDDHRAVYHVSDNGVGFDMRYADKLFGVFQRLHSNREFEGTGVGLALVQRIIHRQGGEVWAQGAVDGGATFSFALPEEEVDE